ncbi:FG-GAP and VCBS repeat-containing protein [Streptomyces naphthomycinicus]|uniref:FG-GAP and VCBS repeat-containing protein n=1 Tax=Streptomyces naphthomycinicus TaxID=2872625 RepID=UPI002889E89F|nr:FG-GAP-like repeat-containing protein [Streptomyces sp. TML10]
MRHSLRLAVASALAACLTGTLVAVSGGQAVAAGSKLADDFNGDGYRDLAIGMPAKTVSGKEGAGAVLLTFGSAHGLTGKHLYITQNSTNIPGAAGYQDSFGSSLASGDMNRDGYADLLVGSEGDASSNGSVTVLWGGTSPFRSALALPSGPSYTGRMFGADIAVGDFTGDSRPDIAVSGQTSLRLYSGTFTRTKAPAGVDVSDADGTGSWNLAAGDFTGDGKDELAVVQQKATRVYGQNPGTTDPGFFTAQARLAGGDRVAAGDLNGDGRDDLAIALSNPRLNPNGLADPSHGSGYITVRYGDPAISGGLAPSGRVYHQNTAGIPGENEKEDEFGAAMSIADINGDHRADLAVGIPSEDFGRTSSAGDVLVLRGSASGLTTTGAARYSQNTSGIPGSAENNDAFGSQVRLADFNRDGKADLVVSAPYEDHGNGAIWQLRGSHSGLSTSSVSTFGPREYGVSASSRIGETLIG